MKKSVLLVMPSLDAGGGEKSLVNLLGVIDTARYDIDVLLFHKTGIFLKMLPDTVNVTEIGGDYRIFSKGLLASVTEFAIKFKWAKALHRILFAQKNKAIKNKAAAEQQSWKNVSAAIKPLEKKYDVAIGFLEKSSVYFTVDKVAANKKIGWIHTNYANSGMDAAFDRDYFKKLDYIVTVSEECAASLELTFPKLKERVRIIHNIISAKLIEELAENGFAPEIGIENGRTNIVSVGRLSHEKGFDFAVEACERLVKRDPEIHWFVIGDGKQHAALAQMIRQKNLEHNFHLLGAKDNPYVYLKKADIYVQPSRFEGKSIAIDEAKMLHKPIVVTNFTTVKDQIADGENGLVAEMDAQSIADRILEILSDESLKNKLVSKLQNENLGTESEIEKLYKLIGS